MVKQSERRGQKKEEKENGRRLVHYLRCITCELGMFAF